MRPLVFVVLVAALVTSGCMGEDDSGPGPSATSCEVEIQDPARAPELEPLSKPMRIAFTTSHGSFTLELDPATAPCNGDSLVDLAREGFFDDTRFHRIVPGFIIQGGDPTATGNGGSGYTTIDPPPPTTKYTKGVVAMAKSQFEPPGSGGSQFFIVTAAEAPLPPDFAVVGKIVEGMDVVDKIGKLGNRQTEAPTERVVIRSTSVSDA